MRNPVVEEFLTVAGESVLDVHLLEVGLCVDPARVVTDLGPKQSFWFTDPDGTHVEVDWVRDPSLAGFHAPVEIQYPLLTSAGRGTGEVSS